MSDKINFDELNIEATNGDATAQLNLGLFYENGVGVMPDPKMANYWFLRSASQGNTNAMLCLAVNLLSGTGIEKDDIEGGAWLWLASLRGDRDAGVALLRVLYSATPEKYAQIKSRTTELSNKLQ
jgi:TPR repeat protein